MITLKEALEIAVTDMKLLFPLEAGEIPSPRIHEDSGYWLFNFHEEEENPPPGGGATAVYKADGRIRYVGSGEIPDFYENAIPVPFPA